MILLPQPRELEIESGCFSGNRHAQVKIHVDTIPPEGYHLEITPNKITMEASTDAGFFYGQKTLNQILVQNPNKLPCLSIRDYPDFKHRGFMLDVSRCQVPKLEFIFQLVDLLADLKYNQLQLYIEHTFTYPGHEIVWGDASPLTSEDILALDAYCKKHFIDLVPNQNSFGHMERWLRYSEYHHLAECPEGFVHPLTGKKIPYGSVLKPKNSSLSFLEDLYATLLPNFTSEYFNIGFDEPWELGHGSSKNAVLSQGKERVCISFLNNVHKLVKKHNRKTLFWADTLLEDPDLAAEIDLDATPIIWGYESVHPFKRQCKTIAETGLEFYVAPGTSTWNTLSGRLDNAIENIKSAAHHGRTNNASGFLLTSWGDNGHHQPWSIIYPPIVQAAGSAWCETENQEIALAQALDLFVFQEDTKELGKTICALGRLEDHFTHFLHNSSLNHHFIFGNMQEITQLTEALNNQEVAQALTKIDAIQAKLHSIQLTSAQPITTHALEEIKLAVDFIKWGSQKILAILDIEKTAPLRADMKHLIGRYEQNWLIRNRPGGLYESSSYLRKLLD